MGYVTLCDKVIMNNKYYVSDKYKDVMFVVRSDPWNVCGTEVILLEGYRGGYTIDGLTIVNEYKKK